jgi:rhodanese-related sulfurtransferase
MKKYINTKKLPMLMLLIGLIVISFTLISGCINQEIDSTESDLQNQIIENINSKESFDLIQNNKDNLNFVIIDVRTSNEFLEGHIKNSINIDYNSNTFKTELSELNKSKKYLIYCRSGRRSASALSEMKSLQFIEVYNMLGGINQWKSDGFHIVK